MSQPEFTCEVRVVYVPEQSQPPDGPFAFAYTVTIRNSGSIAAQLVARQWLITDANGRVQEVRGADARQPGTHDEHVLVDRHRLIAAAQRIDDSGVIAACE